MFSGNRWIPTELGETLLVIWICIILIIMGALFWLSHAASSSKSPLKNKQKINKKKAALRKKK